MHGRMGSRRRCDWDGCDEIAYDELLQLEDYDTNDMRKHLVLDYIPRLQPGQSEGRIVCSMSEVGMILTICSHTHWNCRYLISLHAIQFPCLQHISLKTSTQPSSRYPAAPTHSSSSYSSHYPPVPS